MPDIWMAVILVFSPMEGTWAAYPVEQYPTYKECVKGANEQADHMRPYYDVRWITCAQRADVMMHGDHEEDK